MAITTKILKAVREAATESDFKYKLAAVIFKGSKIISVGYNSVKKTHPLIKLLSHRDDKLYLHAEIHAILRAKECEGADLLVVRIRNDSEEFSMSKPCKMCERFIRRSGIRNVIYSDGEGNLKIQRINKE